MESEKPESISPQLSRVFSVHSLRPSRSNEYDLAERIESRRGDEPEVEHPQHHRRFSAHSLRTLRSNDLNYTTPVESRRGDEPEIEEPLAFSPLSSESLSELEEVLSREESRPGDAPENEDTYEPIPKYRRVGTPFDYFILHLMFTFFGMTGSLVRIGLERLTTFPGSSYGGVLWANFTGCLIMGYCVRSTRLFGPLLDGSARRMTRSYTGIGEIPLYVGLTTGFCGSVTSFSSFISQLFELSARQPSFATSDIEPFRNPGYGVMVWLSYTTISLGVSVAGFLLGRHFARAVDKSYQVGTWAAHHEAILEAIICITGGAGYIACVILTIVEPSWRYWTFSLLFAPWGVFARFWISRFLNPISSKFMVGTFTLNFLAVIILSIMILLQYGTSVKSSVAVAYVGSSSRLITTILQCQVVRAVGDGFCGCLSTVSTLINELHSFKRTRHAYVYGLTSTFSSFAIIVLIFGSFSWTHGLDTSIC